MANPNQRNRTRLGVSLLESRDCPARFPLTGNIANGDVAALNAAIVAANANAEDDTINLAPGGDYTLNAALGGAGNGLTPIRADSRQGVAATITINGHGATIERLGELSASFRIFDVKSDGILRLNDVTVRNGSAPTGESGGAILVEGGGAIDVRNSLFRDNSADEGGGAIAFLDESSDSALWNSTFTDNSNSHETESGGGGAIFVADSSGKVTITNCTIAFNTNFFSPVEGMLPFYGGGLRSNGNAELVNSILSDNTDTDSPNDLAFDLPQGVSFQARNSIIREYGQGTPDAVSITGPGNLLDTNAGTNDPKLKSLSDNGGQSQTLAIPNNSPAVNAGDDNFFYTAVTKAFDQRGKVGTKSFTRKVGSHIDIGAFEFKPNTRISLTSSANPAALGQRVTFTATVIPDSPGPVNGTITFIIDGRSYAPVPVTSRTGRATFSISTLAKGSHVVQAKFTPDVESELDPSSASLIQVIGKVSRRFDR